MRELSREPDCNDCVFHNPPDLNDKCRVCLGGLGKESLPFFKRKESPSASKMRDHLKSTFPVLFRAPVPPPPAEVPPPAELPARFCQSCGWRTQSEHRSWCDTQAPKEKDQPVPILPTESLVRKNIPITTGVLDYFPNALAYVAQISKYGNDKHNPGQPLHHARGKSMDHADCIGRHLVERGTFDVESGYRHSGYLAWRALANLQDELEREEGAPLARGAKLA